MTDAPAVTAEAEAGALAAPPAATRQRLIVIGNGMAGARAGEEILERGGAGLFDITMFGDEPHGNDNRRRPATDRQLVRRRPGHLQRNGDLVPSRDDHRQHVRAKRGLLLYRTQDVIVADNTFDVTASTGAGVIEVENVASGDKIDDNTIRRQGVAGPGIRVIPHSGGIPEHVSIANNTIITDGNADAIQGEAVRDIGIRDNDITFTAPAPDGSGVFLRATAAAMDGLTITGNAISGPLSATGANTYYAAVRLAASPFPIDGVTVALNASRGAIRSLECAGGQANFRLPIVSVGNRWNTAPTCAATVTAGQ